VYYKLIAGSDPFEINPGLKAVEKYNKLTDRQMFFVLLVADPSKDNPLKTLSGRERRERAAILAGYPLEADGKRLDKNGRNLVAGKIESVEEAIEEFKKNTYNEREKSREALRKQIAEIREFLIQDKRLPITDKNGIVKNDKGEEIWVTDQKGLKLAAELAKELPSLEKALNELESLDPIDTKFEGTTYTSADIPDEVAADQTLSLLDQFHESNREKK